jgi:peptidoglycan/xylan/chitin deacetylase (PgdA/CDA1 family)
MSIFRELIGFAIHGSGLPLLIRNTIARHRVTIVVYHNPTADVFDRHLAYLTKRYTIIPLATLVDAMQRKDFSGIRPKSLVITIDDGHRGNYDLLPIIKKYGVMPTIYVVTGVAGTVKHSWFTNHAKPSSESPLTDQDIAQYPDQTRQAMNQSEMEEMSEWIDFGSHTRTHKYLTICDGERAQREIAGSRTDMTGLLGRELDHFCYPNGYYGGRETGLVEKLGYASARTIDVGWNGINTDPFRLRVVGVTDDASVNILAAQMTGLMMYLRYAAHGGWNGRYPIPRHSRHPEVHITPSIAHDATRRVG